MGMVESEGKMQGWLYLIRFNRFGMQYSRKRYFILQDNCLKSFKSIPLSETEEPVRSAIIDSCIRVTDNGRESHHRKVFFIFTLYNTSNHNDQLKLGVISSEEAAKWIRSLQNAALHPVKNLKGSSKRKWQPFSLSVTKRMANKSSIKWTSASSLHVDAMTSDVIAPSPWKIFSCRNGLRLFKEAKDRDSNGRHWGDHPAIMAVGVFDGTSEAVFHAVMSLGPSRTEWDFCFYRGCVVEHLDGHTDIIHIQLYNHWLPWAMKRRELLLRRYWRREDDGTYVILYHSVFHRKCPPQRGYVRASVKSGGFVITPVKQGKECVVKHMLAVDWRIWKSYLMKASARSITISFLERVGALRELFRAKGGNNFHEFLSGEITREIGVPHCEKEDIKTEIDLMRMGSVTEDESQKSNLMGLNGTDDEFFDVPEPSYDERSENGWPLIMSPELCYVDTYQPKLPSAANFVKKLHDLAVQKKGYMDLQDMSWEDSTSCSYGATLANDPSLNMPCSWAAADPSSFLIRGDNYLEDHQKIKAKGTLMQMVAADWLRSNIREDDLASRPGGIVQKYAAQGGPEFFFIINMQVPGTTLHNLALYYMLSTPLEETPLLERFVNGDDAFRNSRFKLIPYISQGSWIVKQSVGKKAGLVGQALEVRYFRGKNYLELDIDVGSSTVARGVVSLVLGYLANLVIEMAFLIQGNTEEELPEFLLGTCRLNHLDASKAVSTDSIGIS
ncbi:Pleckstrin-like proteiny (PH) and lipid-binding START domains-containing protein [Abeliophyllum distichum]|uniref:Pleckstrin-like proteiny (PH) and lipid-binding START domains-containing protein n=1 Tax=Abeliophyllum distichum TaxID=126358 RepID=A0ABD1ULP7_9LAMI